MGLGFLMPQQQNAGDRISVYLVTNAYMLDGLQVAIMDERQIIVSFFSTNSDAREAWIDQKSDLAILKLFEILNEKL